MSEIDDTLATINRVLGRTPAPIISHDKRVAVPMTMMDSLQRSVSDAALADRARLDARDRLQAMSDAAFERRNAHFRTAHRDASGKSNGSLAPIGVSTDPALNAHHLARVASTRRSEAEAGTEAGISAAAMAKAVAEHDAAIAARSRRFKTSYKGGAQ